MQVGPTQRPPSRAGLGCRIAFSWLSGRFPVDVHRPCANVAEECQTDNGAEKWRRKRTTRDGEGESSCLSKALGLGSEEEISESRFNSLSAKLLSAALGVKPQKILLLLENRQ